MIIYNNQREGGIVRMNMSGNDSIRRTYTVSEVAEILGVSLRTVYYLCESTKDFKIIRMGRRCIRIHKESFDKWLDQE